jgi:hypothetical protein
LFIFLLGDIIKWGVVEIRDEDVLILLGLGALVLFGLSMASKEKEKEEYVLPEEIRRQAEQIRSFEEELRRETEKAVKAVESHVFTEEEKKAIEESVSYVLKKLSEIGVMPQPIQPIYTGGETIYSGVYI